MSLSQIKVNNTSIISVDNEPVRESENLVKSGSICKFIAKNAIKKITSFIQEDSNQIRSAYYYTFGKDRVNAYVKHPDTADVFKIMTYQYDASYNLVGYGEIWPKEYCLDTQIAGAVYFNIHVLRRNSTDTENVALDATNMGTIEVLINYEDNSTDGLTLLDNSIFKLLGNVNGMLTKALCKWGSDDVVIKCSGSIGIQAMIYQYDADFTNLGYTKIWSTYFKDSKKTNAVYFDIRVAKRVNASYQPITTEDLPYIDIYCNYVPFNQGLVANVLGDSITAEGNVTDALLKYGMKINNYGVSGTSIAGSSANSFINRYSSMTDDCDIVLVIGGVNDWRGGVYFGNFEDGAYDQGSPLHGNTFYSALHILCSGLKDKYINTNSNKQIYFCTPMHNQFSLEGYPDLPEFVIENGKIVAKKYGNGDILSKYVEAIKEVCEYYAIPVIDLYATSFIAPIQQDNNTKYTNDGLHPNTAGGKIIATSILRGLNVKI